MWKPQSHWHLIRLQIRRDRAKLLVHQIRVRPKHHIRTRQYLLPQLYRVKRIVVAHTPFHNAISIYRDRKATMLYISCYLSYQEKHAKDGEMNSTKKAKQLVGYSHFD